MYNSRCNGKCALLIMQYIISSEKVVNSDLALSRPDLTSSINQILWDSLRWFNSEIGWIEWNWLKPDKRLGINEFRNS